MPSFVRSVDQHTGKIVYLYSIGGEDPVNVARQLIQNADAPFTYQGRIQGQTGTLPIENIGAMLESGGEVAGQAMINSTSVIVRFMNPDEVSLTPADAIKATADMLMGLPGNSFDDADFGFGGEDFGEPFGGDSFGGYGDDGGFVDPRGAAASDMNNQALYNDQAVVAAGGEQAVGIGEWILTLILLAIPVVNLVFLIIWLVSKKTKKSKKNYLIVQLIFAALSIILAGLLVFFARDALLTAIQNAGINVNINGQAQQTQVENVNVPDVSDDDLVANQTGVNANSNQLANANANSNQLANSNAAANANSNAANANANSEEDGTEVANGFSSDPAADEIKVEATIDNLKISEVSPGVKIAIITSTMTNLGTSPISPHDALAISGTQGALTLNWVVDGTEDYDTTLINEQIPPGSAGTYQAAYYVDGANGNPVQVRIANMDTGAMLADQSIPVE